MAMAVAGCSADGGELGITPSKGFDSDDGAIVEPVTENDSALGTAQSEKLATTAEKPPATPAAAPTARSAGDADGSAPHALEQMSEQPPSQALLQHDTLYTSGRQLLDTCGNPFVVRGVEQIFGDQLPQGNDWVGLLDQIAASGVNAVRILAGTDTLGTADVDSLLDAVAEHGMVAYVTPYGSNHMHWLEGQDVREMLARHEKYILIDAFGEPTFDDRARFVTDSIDAIRSVRSWGYRVPLTVTANQFGRDLPSLFELGAEIIAADPLHNTVLGWQAYWSTNGYYQDRYGMSFAEAVDTIAGAPFPIQLGLDRITDFPSTQTADFGTLMSATEAQGIGWLWWDWYNPYGDENNLSNDGSATALTPTGDSVLNAHAASVKNTARRVCIR